jgi:N-acetylglucosaminyldiphosphoundecaprenol N-acetyl-beta-D-mannosaminyltransferase
VATSLASKLLQRNPNLRVAGIYSPPFRVPSPQEDQELIDRINAAKPDVLWVALGCPKQEVWMQAHRDRLRVGVMLGVGQAFDIHAGRLKQAPYWMRSNGLEWLYRLFREPNRLWKRYLLTNSQFILLQAWEFFFKSGSR